MKGEAPKVPEAITIVKGIEIEERENNVEEYVDSKHLDFM